MLLGIAGHAPADVPALGVGHVFLPAVIVGVCLELGLREKDIDFVDRVFLTPAVPDRRDAVLLGVRLEIERDKLSLHEAGTGDEGNGSVVKTHVLGPEGGKRRVDKTLAVRTVKLDVHRAALKGGGCVLAVGGVADDEVDRLVLQCPEEVLDDTDTRSAHPEHRREGKCEVGGVFGKLELRGLFVQPAVETVDKLVAELVTHEGRGIAAYLPGPRAEIGVMDPVQGEALDPELVEVGLAPVDDDVDDVLHEELRVDDGLEYAGLFPLTVLAVDFLVPSDVVHMGEDVVVRPCVSPEKTDFTEHEIVPYGDDIPLLHSLGHRITGNDKVVGHEHR